MRKSAIKLTFQTCKPRVPGLLASSVVLLVLSCSKEVDTTSAPVHSSVSAEEAGGIDGGALNLTGKVKGSSTTGSAGGINAQAQAQAAGAAPKTRFNAGADAAGDALPAVDTMISESNLKPYGVEHAQSLTPNYPILHASHPVAHGTSSQEAALEIARGNLKPQLGNGNAGQGFYVWPSKDAQELVTDGPMGVKILREDMASIGVVANDGYLDSGGGLNYAGDSGYIVIGRLSKVQDEEIANIRFAKPGSENIAQGQFDLSHQKELSPQQVKALEKYSVLNIYNRDIPMNQANGNFAVVRDASKFKSEYIFSVRDRTLYTVDEFVKKYGAVK